MLPKVHIVIASIEKIVPTLEDAAQLLRVLARSATGQDASVYTTLSTGPRRPGDPDGPSAYHVVILDNGRSSMLGGEFEDMLRCIRCGACMNHCPVYQAIGGHAYGWVYPGPMGAVLTPSLIGVAEGGQLPERLDLLRPLRRGLPGPHSAAEDDASLARARIRAPSVARAFSLRPRLLGVFRQAADALPLRDGPRRARDASCGARQRTVQLDAARRRLDAVSRSRRAGEDDVSESVAGEKRGGEVSARDAIFANMRRSLGVTGAEAPRRFEVETRLAKAPAGIVPKRGQGSAEARIATFKAEAERAAASLAEVATLAEVPVEVARFLRDNNAPATLRMGADDQARGDAVERDVAGHPRTVRRTGTISTPFRSPSRPLPRPGRLRSFPARTIRRR